MSIVMVGTIIRRFGKQQQKRLLLRQYTDSMQQQWIRYLDECPAYMLIWLNCAVYDNLAASEQAQL